MERCRNKNGRIKWSAQRRPITPNLCSLATLSRSIESLVFVWCANAQPSNKLALDQTRCGRRWKCRANWPNSCDNCCWNGCSRTKRTGNFRMLFEMFFSAWGIIDAFILFQWDWLCSQISVEKNSATQAVWIMAEFQFRLFEWRWKSSENVDFEFFHNHFRHKSPLHRFTASN